MPDQKDMLTIAQAAKELKVSRQRMHKLIESYGIEMYVPSPKLFFLHKSELKKIPRIRKPGPRIVPK